MKFLASTVYIGDNGVNSSEDSDDVGHFMATTHLIQCH